MTHPGRRPSGPPYLHSVYSEWSQQANTKQLQRDGELQWLYESSCSVSRYGVIIQRTDIQTNPSTSRSSLSNHYRSSLGRSPPKRTEICFYSKLDVNLGRNEIAAASTTIKIPMTQDVCGGGIGRVISWQALRDFLRSFGFLLSVFSKTKAQYFAYPPCCLRFTCCGRMIL